METRICQQLTTAVTTDMSCMARTQGSASMMVLGMETFQLVVQLKVSGSLVFTTAAPSYEIPTYAENCPKLDHPSYGKVIVTSYTPESVAYYRCQYGYKLHGSASRKCQHDGRWYGVAPTCQRSRY